MINMMTVIMNNKNNDLQKFADWYIGYYSSCNNNNNNNNNDLRKLADWYIGYSSSGMAGITFSRCQQSTIFPYGIENLWITLITPSMITRMKI